MHMSSTIDSSRRYSFSYNHSTTTPRSALDHCTYLRARLDLA